MCERPPTEIDRLLPGPVSNRKTNDQSPNRRIVIFAASTLVLLVSIAYFALPASRRGDDRKRRDFKPKEQLGALQHLTENSIMGAFAASSKQKVHHHSHPEGKVKVISGNEKKNKEGIYHCTSQVMIMRHCDKEVKVRIHGKEHTTDKRDKFGDRHCSAKGKRRSKYIATLFVEPDEYESLLEKQGGKREVADGIPPVPMIKSSLSKVSSAAAPKKPQFPTPLKLYALAPERPANKPSKVHDNFREIETITPLSEKFDLDVDERFGVYEEGDLASDFFEQLSERVTGEVGMMKRAWNGTDSSVAAEARSSLCDNGMTVVNWKHSRIPYLARALGCGANQGCPKKYKGHDFDTVWLLTFQYTLLLDKVDDPDSEFLALELESLSQTASSSSFRHNGKKRHSSGHGNWKVSAELVNEGFDSN